MQEEILKDMKSSTSSILDNSIEAIHPKNQFLKGDATIAEVLISLDRNLLLPNDMAQDVTVKKLTHSNLAIKANFEGGMSWLFHGSSFQSVYLPSYPRTQIS
jgi:hypothetical protein